MKYVLAVLVSLAFSAPMHADSDFTFSFTEIPTINGINGYNPGPDPGLSGSGSFTVVPDESEWPFGYIVTSLTGEMNGQPMELVEGELNLDQPEFLYHDEWESLHH
jgi:hypothetical protein